MTVIDNRLLSSMRTSWRGAPKEFKNAAPDLVSRVFLDENSTIIPIFECAAGFRVGHTRDALVFENLDHAEVAAVALLKQDAQRYE